ncbi:MAG: redox-sensing transcriptional repressor Rex [Muribaculaceae bacterium]|jgi:redox-sensing transcriptional repressor|nr:redox-sensing transcriptional repressor Rex [Muribaculaceae bacterium]MBQ5696887.1 redox-sensing transcriptional repressor Rex [Muribaculaceae bacterium]
MIDDSNNIILPEPTLRRLPWYLAYIDILKANGVETVSSTQISKAISVDSSQIAKDLSFLNIKGKTRIGYEVDTLSNVLSHFLGFKEIHNAFIVGVGSLGAALIHDTGLSNYGLNIIAGFDINPDIIGKKICDVPIFSIDEMQHYQQKLNASIGILAVPANQAQDAADTMAASGLKAIWNFTPYRIKVAEGIVMSNTSIYAHLALIYNRLRATT